jgi:hypothetical protein
MTQEITKTKSSGIAVNNILQNSLSITKPSQMVEYIESNQEAPSYLKIYNDVTEQLEQLIKATLYDKQKILAELHLKVQNNLSLERELEELYEEYKIECEKRLEKEANEKINAINEEEAKDSLPNEEEYSNKRLAAKNYFDYAEKYNMIVPPFEKTYLFFCFRLDVLINETKMSMGNSAEKLKEIKQAINEDKIKKEQLSLLVDNLKSCRPSKIFDGYIPVEELNHSKLQQVKKYILDEDNHIQITSYFMPLNSVYKDNIEQQRKILFSAIAMIAKKTQYGKEDDKSIMEKVKLWEEDINIYSYYAIQKGFRNYYKANDDFPRSVALLTRYIKVRHDEGIVILCNINFINSINN